MANDPMGLRVFRTPGLGDSSYLLASHGEAVLVDPQRDAWRFLAFAEDRGWRIRYVAETHVHNDYISGAIETRSATGAEILAPARGAYEFVHRPMDEGDEIELGALRLTAMATPGHTPEHLAWAVASADATRDGGSEGLGDIETVFSGGSLLVGSVGRTDLLGPALTEALTRDQQRSLARLAALPGTTRILPTHGAGSFCGAGPMGGEGMTTVDAERFANPTFALAGGEPQAFRDSLLDGLGRVPDYYAHMAKINRQGPRVLGRLILPPALDPAAFEATAAEAAIVDVRDRATFAAGHIRGAMNIELDGGAFSGYVGWLVPFAGPIVLVLPDGSSDALAEATTELLRIGYERVQGWLEGGLDAWAASGRGVSTYQTTDMASVHGERAAGRSSGTLLDVRQPIEWQTGVVPDSAQIFVADLPERLAELSKSEPVTIFCRTGHRASIAASVLDAAGYDVRLVGEGGAADWPGQLEPLADGRVGAAGSASAAGAVPAAGSAGDPGPASS